MIITGSSILESILFYSSYVRKTSINTGVKTLYPFKYGDLDNLTYPNVFNVKVCKIIECFQRRKVPDFKKIGYIVGYIKTKSPHNSLNYRGFRLFLSTRGRNRTFQELLFSILFYTSINTGFKGGIKFQ
jgi:hypothetical protein